MRRAGSSPRVRGTPRPCAGGADRDRFIPACAGNARPPPEHGASSPVHPRVCGERDQPAPQPTGVTGSSPRVRGTLETRIRVLVRERFIPACAGNAPAQGEQVGRSPVHPRVCGERRLPFDANRPADGSSPRVRGTHHCRAVIFNMGRFIPACAGNACRRRTAPTTSTVHPRVCGERFSPDFGSNWCSGSSPRVRGTREPQAPGGWNRRFIPACAGNARPGARWDGPHTVHPRVCGERAPWSGKTYKEVGSSPRVRGTRRHCPSRRRDARFIPACAGNAPNRSRPRGRRSVHPRVCGERAVPARPGSLPVGSSPRVRGTPSADRLSSSRPRFIPACAGNARDDRR